MYRSSQDKELHNFHDVDLLKFYHEKDVLLYLLAPIDIEQSNHFHNKAPHRFDSLH